MPERSKAHRIAERVPRTERSENLLRELSRPTQAPRRRLDPCFLGSWYATIIGSEEIRRRVARAAAAHLTPYKLGLGGQDLAVISPDMEMGSVAKAETLYPLNQSPRILYGVFRSTSHLNQL
ncbi:hypothetical protein FRC09_006885 [Ceratobasidium sp. 395]|nr:hypothetical protein FRC09_006885 [Ceratobasidium sp. 395]